MTGGSPLEILLVEDNPGDARYIREVLREATELAESAFDRRTDALVETPVHHTSGTPELVHETRLADGLDRLDDAPPDVVLLDLNLPDSDGLDTLETTLDHTETVPVVVLTGLRDRETGVEAIQRGAEEYLVKDEIGPDLLLRSVYHAIERKAQRRSLEQQRARLAALNNLHAVVREVTDAVIEQSTREEIEAVVCETLVDSESYDFAWVGEVDSATDTVSPRASAGDGAYLDDVTVSVDPDDPQSGGPTGRAVRTWETQVARDGQLDDAYEPWRERAAAHGYRSSAAIPIVHEGSFYGVLNVYAARPDAFDGEEREVVGQLGEVVGQAITAAERKRALISDDVTEIELQARSVFETLDRPETDGTTTLDRFVPVGGDTYLAFGTATEEGLSLVEALVESERTPHWKDVTVHGENGDGTRLEVRLSGPPALTTVAAHNGHLEQARIQDGDVKMTVQYPPDVDVRRLVEALRDHYPEMELLAQRQVPRTEDTARQFRQVFEEELTTRQRTVLETAIHSGYFEWPRKSTAEDVAESLGVSAPTLHQHLRKAEQKLFTSLLRPTLTSE